MAHSRSSGRARCRLGHGGPRLGEEVLDDHLLDVAEARVGGGDGLEGGQLSRPVVADADQDPGGEGDVRARPPHRAWPTVAPAPCPGRGDAPRGPAPVTRSSCPGWPRRGADAASSSAKRAPALAWGRRPVSSRTSPHTCDEVVDRGGETVVLQPGLRQRVAQLGALAQGEERLVATGVPAGAGDAQHLLGGEVGRGEAGRAPWRRCSSRSGRDRAW